MATEVMVSVVSNPGTGASGEADKFRRAVRGKRAYSHTVCRATVADAAMS
jgi:hypothetical protein